MAWPSWLAGVQRAWQRVRGLRRQRALARRPIPDDLWKRTLVRYPFLRRKDPADVLALRELTSLFLDRKEFAAAGGLRLTDAMAVEIAAQAVLPVLRLGLARYDGFVGIVVHPGPVRARREVTDGGGLVHAWDEELAGEAMDRGPVMLSWEDVRSGGRGAEHAYNVVIHEFAHVLDLHDRHPSAGAREDPEDETQGAMRGWRAVLAAEHAALVADVEAGRPTVVDPYGAENTTECFAVASEAFFVTPHALRDGRPALYALLQRLYRQDPAEETVLRAPRAPSRSGDGDVKAAGPASAAAGR